jgi:hypothetical protein
MEIPLHKAEIRPPKRSVQAGISGKFVPMSIPTPLFGSGSVIMSGDWREKYLNTKIKDHLGFVMTEQ